MMLSYSEMQEMHGQWKKIINAHNEAIEKMFRFSTVVATEEGGPADDNENKIEEMRMEVSGIMLNEVKKLMKIPLDDVTILDDEWFWAEWDASPECFYYMLGKTANLRMEHEMAPRPKIDNASYKDKWICIWKEGYDPLYSVVSEAEAPGMFVTWKGYSEEDIDVIMNLETGEMWANDPNGLIIVKG